MFHSFSPRILREGRYLPACVARAWPFALLFAISILIQACFHSAEKARDVSNETLPGQLAAYVCKKKPGVAYRSSRNLNDRWNEIRGPRYGDLVRPIEVVDGWLSVSIEGYGIKYLPVKDTAGHKDLFEPTDALKNTLINEEAFVRKLQEFQRILAGENKCPQNAFDVLKEVENDAPAQHPRLGVMHYLLGLCYRERNMLDKEQLHYERVVQIGDASLLPHTHLNLARSTFLQARHDRTTGSWLNLEKRAREALSFHPRNAEVLFWLGCAEIGIGKAQNGYMLLEEARNIGSLSEGHFVMAGDMLSTSALPWSKTNSFFREGRKLFPNSDILLNRHATVCHFYGDDYATQDGDIVSPAHRTLQKRVTSSFWKEAIAVTQGHLQCNDFVDPSKKPTVVYNWANDKIQAAIELTWPSLAGSTERYGGLAPLRWHKTLADTFTWGSFAFEERDPYVAIFRDVFVLSTSQGGLILDSSCRIFVNNHDEWEFAGLDTNALTASVADIALWPFHPRVVKLWGASSFYHVLAEEVCRVMLLKQVWSTDSSVQFLIVEGEDKGKGLQAALMEIFQLPESRFLRLTSNGARIGELNYADWRLRDVQGKSLRDRGKVYYYLPPRRVVKYLQSHFEMIPSFTDDVPTGNPKDLLWISRQTSRRLMNESVLLEHARSLWRDSIVDGEVVVLRDGDFTSLSKVSRQFKRARVVFGVMGAGLTNIVFSNSGTHVIEVACPQRSCHSIGHLAVAADLKYWLILGPRLLHGMSYVPVQLAELTGILSEIMSGDTHAARRNIAEPRGQEL